MFRGAAQPPGGSFQGLKSALVQALVLAPVLDLAAAGSPLSRRPGLGPKTTARINSATRGKARPPGFVGWPSVNSRKWSNSTVASGVAEANYGQ